MGEGKTDVILPNLAAKSANKEQLVRIIVLRSLFNTNYEDMSLKLGGMLNIRIY
jgi:hypothetical protein